MWAALLRQDFVAAREFARERYELHFRDYGLEHVWTAWALCDWARCRAATGETTQAVAQIQQALPVARKHWSYDSDQLWFLLSDAAHVMVDAGHFEEAERYARESLEVIERAHREDLDAWRAQSLELLGKALLGQKKTQEAVLLLARAQAMYQQLGPAWTKTAQRIATQLQILRPS